MGIILVEKKTIYSVYPIIVFTTNTMEPMLMLEESQDFLLFLGINAVYNEKAKRFLT